MQIVLLKTKKKLLNFMPIGSFKAGIHEPKPVLVLGLDNDPRDQGQQNVQNLVPVVAVCGTLIQGISFTLTIATLYFVLFEQESKEKEAQAKNIIKQKMNLIKGNQYGLVNPFWHQLENSSTYSGYLESLSMRIS